MTRGLTLVELIITISLTAILGIPAGILLSRQLGAAIDARDYTVAMSLARYEMERLDSFNDVYHADLFVTNSPVTTTIVNYLGYPYTLERTVDCLTGDCTNGNFNVKRVDVTVRKTGSISPLATLTTYRTQNVLFGSP